MAANDLLEIVRGVSSPQMAERALDMVAQLGEQGRDIEPALLELREARPEPQSLQSAINAALIGTGSRLAGQIYAEKLRASPDSRLLRDLAQTGVAGKSAGPEVVEL